MTKVFLILAVTAAAVVMLADSHSISKFEHSDEEQRMAAGIGPGCVRVAVGIEDAEDVVADFLQALG